MMAGLIPLFKDWDVTDVIDEIRVPVLAIQGEDDQYGTLAQVHVVEERSYAPVELAILPECKHSPHLEQQDMVLANISTFLTRLEQFETRGHQAA